MKNKIFLLLLYVCSFTFAFAQCDEYLQKAKLFLDKGNCEAATKSYTVYKNLGGVVDYNIEKRIEDCLKSKEEPKRIVISYLFSVSQNEKVRFSPGNLQYQASTKTWRFADHQYNLIGISNKNISRRYSGWIDLFGWGTSDFDGKKPSMTTCDNSDYPSSIAGTRYDWGLYNKIYNHSTFTTDYPTTWRTLTATEWNYLLYTRAAATINGTTNARFAQVKVNGVAGVMLFPDVFTWPNGAGSAPKIFNDGASNWNSVNYTSAQFAILEKSGVVFLPASGYRMGDSFFGDNFGYYWSSTPSSSIEAYCLGFYSGKVRIQKTGSRCRGYAVRLVKNSSY